MDILYVVGRGSDWQNNELRYSLRSLAKFGKNVGRVFLVGYKPEFVSDKVIHIPCEDPTDRKHKNILHKVLFAAYHSNIDKHFLISSDDHYYTRPTNFDKLPVMYKAIEIPSKLTGSQLWCQYHLSLRDTRNLLLKYGLSIFQTNPHCNTHFDVRVYEENRKIFNEGYAMPNGGELNCIMGNLLIKNGCKPVQFHDAKLSNNATLEDIRAAAELSGCISSKEGCAKSVLVEFLESEFNNKCIYEK